MYDKQTLDLMLEALGKLAIANDRIDRVKFAQIVEPIMTLSNDVESYLIDLATSEAAQKAIEEEAVDTDYSQQLVELLSQLDLQYFLWRRGKSTFLCIVERTENSEAASAKFADVEGYFEYWKSYPIAERWECQQYFYLLIPVNLVPERFKEGMPLFKSFGAAMQYSKMYETEEN